MRKKGMIAEKYISQKYIVRNKYVWKQEDKTRYVKFRLTGVILYKLVTVMNHKLISKYFTNFKYVDWQLTWISK